MVCLCVFVIRFDYLLCFFALIHCHLVHEKLNTAYLVFLFYFIPGNEPVEQDGEDAEGQAAAAGGGVCVLETTL